MTAEQRIPTINSQPPALQDVTGQEAEVVLRSLEQELTQLTDLDAVLEAISRRVSQVVSPTHQWACLYDDEQQCYVGWPVDFLRAENTFSNPILLIPAGPLAAWLQEHPEALYLPPGRAFPGDVHALWYRRWDAEWEHMEAIGAVVYVPFRARGHLSGWLALGPRQTAEPYTADELAFLTKLGRLSALAVENGRLFAQLHHELMRCHEARDRMEDVFSSLGSGIITTNVHNQIVLFNQAASAILGIHPDEAQDRFSQQVLHPLGNDLQALLEVIKRRQVDTITYETQPTLPGRGTVWLRVKLSPLENKRGKVTGVAIVVDDLTERRQLEARARRIRETFERYVSPAIVEQMLSNPDAVRLGGVRREVTSFYADIRGFTAFSENTTPEFQIDVLNKHLTLATGAILAHGGTLDKFVGDAAMAIFNAPIPQADHVMRAIRAALATQRAVQEHHQRVDERERLHFGIGITVGDAVIGNIGSAVLHNFTAIGDCVNLSARLSDIAAPGQVLISEAVYERVRDRIVVRPVGSVQVQGHRRPEPAFEVCALVEEEEDEETPE